VVREYLVLLPLVIGVLGLIWAMWPRGKRLGAIPGTVTALTEADLQKAPGIASHAKWKASFDLYKEGKIRLEDFLEAWSGWVVLAPIKPVTATDIQKRVEDAWAKSAERLTESYRYKVSTQWDGASGNLYSTDGSSSDNVPDIWNKIDFNGLTNRYGTLNLAKRKLGT
jgi:hypothetical protein